MYFSLYYSLTIPCCLLLKSLFLYMATPYKMLKATARGEASGEWTTSLNWYYSPPGFARCQLTYISKCNGLTFYRSKKWARLPGIFIFPLIRHILQFSQKCLRGKNISLHMTFNHDYHKEREGIMPRYERIIVEQNLHGEPC